MTGCQTCHKMDILLWNKTFRFVFLFKALLNTELVLLFALTCQVKHWLDFLYSRGHSWCGKRSNVSKCNLNVKDKPNSAYKYLVKFPVVQ